MHSNAQDAGYPERLPAFSLTVSLTQLPVTLPTPLLSLLTSVCWNHPRSAYFLRGLLSKIPSLCVGGGGVPCSSILIISLFSHPSADLHPVVDASGTQSHVLVFIALISAVAGSVSLGSRALP